MQPLFTENFLSHYLIDFKLSNVPKIRLARNIIEGLILELKSGKLESLKEEEFKTRFLNEFFGDVLGFNYGNSNFWTLSEEVKTKVDGTKVDGALGFFGKNKKSSDVRAVIEIKDANKNLDVKQNRKDSKSAVSQAFEYASKMGGQCKWIIVSNFKEVRFYSNFQGKYQVFFLEDLSDENKLKELLFLFHKDRFIKKDNISSTEQLYKISSLELKENEKSIHIVDEIYSSLKRFEGLKYIDPNYLATIKPFNILNEHVWHYSDNKLLTINPKIHALFKHLDFEDGKIKISDELKKELENEKVIEYEDKIYSFIRFLNHSQIIEISCIEDYNKVILRRSHVLGFSHKHFFRLSDKDGFTKSIDILKYKSCDCISCNFKSFDFKHLLSKLKIAQNKDECITLEYAYGNYLVSANNYKNAYNIYKSLCEKIKGKEGCEIEYFLAKLNMKYLHNLVWEDKKLKDSIEIKEEIRSIDLNRILYEEIEYSINYDVRNYLLKIKDENLLLSVKDKVEELVDKIANLRKHYDNGNDGYMGSNYFHDLASEYYNLQLHLNKNRIIYNVFYKYKLLTAKVFKGLIDSYLTKGNGLSSFNSFYLLEFITNINPTEFQKLLSKVDFLDVNEGCDKKIISSITNLLKSYFEDGLFANSPYKNRILEEYLIDLQFSDRYISLVANSFTLLSKITISKSLFEPLSKVIIHFLSIEDNLSWHELREFSKFLTVKGNSFTSEQLINILEIAIERDKPNNNKYEGLIESSSKSLHKFYPNIKISKKHIIKRAIGNISGCSKWNYVSYLLLISDEQCKNILNKEVEDVLDEKFDVNFYDHLIRKKLYDYKRKDYFKRLVEDVSNSKEIGFKNEFKGNNPVFDGYRFYNFIILLNILNINKESELLNVFANISEYEKWLLNPEKYNYSNFDAKWILASDNKFILGSLSGIEDIVNAVEIELKKEFNPILSEIYYKYLL
ncbi:type IIL restriction-modification enzyme MmeI [Flavivirga abyssicola]|uniref:type IIL restriction-modification enzyme MmeI n=1 Tax=Flavivirga abyssicola TaxID=3063533 RepID=UPI0026E09D53|nr:type IIL restriction-modification enzyme MmeI [Flavivirga sp. MEBiC07777]WVK12730.1 type IIL restriction-modification enzyme MmeI [Flavivirga sp. MEBiC07777]